MKCLNDNCDAKQIEKDDNFCYKCGHWTSRGYSFIKDYKNIKKIQKGTALKLDNNISILLSLSFLIFIIIIALIFIKGNDFFKPIFAYKKEIDNYLYGYKKTSINTENQYFNVQIDNKEEVLDAIYKDLEFQNSKCLYAKDVFEVENYLEKEYDIVNISFCDIPMKNVKKIKQAIERIYLLFPNIKGALTNITITNGNENINYIAKFDPKYVFINKNNDINNYNKGIKTQILINSYYFLNDKILNTPIEVVAGDNYYVDGATWESILAHEFGHYISFVSLLKENNIDSISFINKYNESLVEKIVNKYSSGIHSDKIVEIAVSEYNNKYNEMLNIEEFAQTISNYASIKDKNGNLISEEIIAEAIHDYYLHDINCNKTSYEIVNIIQQKLVGEI